jgi:MFS family permease
MSFLSSTLLENKRVLSFGIMMFFVFFADVMMSYISPVFIEAKLNSTLWMGLILSSSSVVGLIADIFISKQFAQKEYRFFSRWLLALALFFPMSLLFMPAQPLTFLVAMAIWGIYYECISFSKYNFVHRAVHNSQHAKAWGILEVFKALGGLVAPIAATFLLDISAEAAMYVVIGSLVVAMVIFYWYRGTYSQSSTTSTQQAKQTPSSTRNFFQELLIWKILMKKIWPVYIFFFSFVLLESAFWTIGPLLSEEIRTNHSLSGFLLSAYILPSLFIPLLTHLLSNYFSKKRMAFLSATVGAVILTIGTWMLGPSPWLIVVVLTSATFFAIDYPAIEAVFEDYISRIDEYGNDLIGLQGTATSLSYIIGPALAGSLASWYGTSATLGLFALFLATTSAVLLVITPRKIRMPYQQLEQLPK